MNPSRPRTVVRLAQLGVLTLALAAGMAAAEPDAQAQREIDHLLEFVGTSNCTYVRNGEPHPAAEAREHQATK